MALIKCPGCGQLISDRAARCPKCGMQLVSSTATPPRQNTADNPMPMPKKSNTALYVVLAALLVLAAAGAGAYLFKDKINGFFSGKTDTAMAMADSTATQDLATTATVDSVAATPREKAQSQIPLITFNDVMHMIKQPDKAVAIATKYGYNHLENFFINHVGEFSHYFYGNCSKPDENGSVEFAGEHSICIGIVDETDIPTIKVYVYNRSDFNALVSQAKQAGFKPVNGSTKDFSNGTYKLDATFWEVDRYQSYDEGYLIISKITEWDKDYAAVDSIYAAVDSIKEAAKAAADAVADAAKDAVK